MKRHEFEEKTDEFERKFEKYQAHCKPIALMIERGEFYSAANQLQIAEDLFSDGLFEELNYLASESDDIDPPRHEMDICKASDGFRVGE